MAIAVFVVFVGLILILATFSSRKASGVGGYFVAGSSVHWGVNGIAFAGGYLSVASFLGIAGLIAFYGYDGFLYSIGFLAGWVVALFVIAEPMKRMGTYTFSDALNRNYKHPGIHLAAGLSVLVISFFYLVPQMVGAGVLVEPLLGIPHSWGVVIVGSVVIFIVASGGMTSTTYVQFFNGGLLLAFALVMSMAVMFRGIDTDVGSREEGRTDLGEYHYHQTPVEFTDTGPVVYLQGSRVVDTHRIIDPYTGRETLVLYKLSRLIPAVPWEDDGYMVVIKGRSVHFSEKMDMDHYSVEWIDHQVFVRIEDWWRLDSVDDTVGILVETQYRSVRPDGSVLVNGAPEIFGNRLRQMGGVLTLPETYGGKTGPVGPFRILEVFSDRETCIRRVKDSVFTDSAGENVIVYYEEPTPGSHFMSPGLMFPLHAQEGEPALNTLLYRLNFISLMLALFLGTAALPHILIRYYTVPSPDAARKSTIVAITGIGLFYILTLYLGVGSVVAGALHPETSNMSAPLLARSFGEILFAFVSGIAFTTVLATVSGLIIAASGAVAHDLLEIITRRNVSSRGKVLAGRLSAIFVGVIGIFFGISFRQMNVSFLVGWAFAVAASANLPALLCMLFWKKTTAEGIIASILVGIVSSVGLILVSPDMWAYYGYHPSTAPMPLNQPGIISIPLSFIVLISVSLATQKRRTRRLETT
jgi:cation/acetate symporter